MNTFIDKYGLRIVLLVPLLALTTSMLMTALKKQ